MNIFVLSMVLCGALAAPRPQELFQALQRYKGNVAFAYNTGHSSRTENVHADGSHSGSFSVLDASGIVRTVHYRAGKGIGFQVIGDVGVDQATAEAAERLKEQLPTPPTNPPNYGGLPVAPTNPPNYGELPVAPTSPPKYRRVIPRKPPVQPPPDNALYRRPLKFGDRIPTYYQPDFITGPEENEYRVGY